MINKKELVKEVDTLLKRICFDLIDDSRCKGRCQTDKQMGLCSGLVQYRKQILSLLSKEEEAIRAEYQDLLRQAVELIKVWHNGTAEEKLGKEQAVFMWNVYYNHAPEMKAIREALKESNNQQG